MTPQTFVRKAMRLSLLGEVTSAYDAVEVALNEARRYERPGSDQGIETHLMAARDLLFAVRLKLDDSP